MGLDFIKKAFQNKSRNYVVFSQLLNTIIAVIYGKLVAVYVLPEDFGVFSIQMATYTFFFTLLIDPITLFIKASNNTLLPKIGSRSFMLTTIIMVVTTMILFISFLNFYLNIYSISLNIIFMVLFPFSTLSIILLNYFNTSNKLIDFSKLSVLKALSGLIFITLFFVLGLNFVDNVQVLWLMQIIGVLVGLIFFLPKYRVYRTKFKIAYQTFIKKYMRFAGPLMFMAIWAWCNNYFDKYAIEYFLTMEDVGNYNASYSVGSKFFLFLSPLFMILLTPMVYSVSHLNVKKHTIQKYSLYYLIFAIPILVAIYYLKDFIGSILLSENYKAGFSIIFWIALAFFIYTLTKLFELLFYAEQRTKVIMTGNIISAILNIFLNVLLIPIWGLLGAALATCIGFTAYLGVIYYNFKNYKV